MTLWPFSQGELRGRRERFLERLLTNPEALLSRSSETPQRRDYEVIALAGGFPLALERAGGPTRTTWFRDFVSMVVERDVMEIRHVRQREVVPNLLRILASQTAQVGLAAHLLGVTPTRQDQRHPATLTEFGHPLESFGVNEIIKQAGWSVESVRCSHYRTKDGAEVDLVIETDDGRIASVEIKSAGPPVGLTRPQHSVKRPLNPGYAERRRRELTSRVIHVGVTFADSDVMRTPIVDSVVQGIRQRATAME